MTNGNEPIAPELRCNLTAENNLSEVWHVGGLTKREYFAGLTLQALLTTPAKDKPEIFAEAAILLADALIAQLNKPTR